MKLKDFYCPNCCSFKDRRDVSVKYNDKALAHGLKEIEYYFCNRCGCGVNETQKVLELLISRYPWR